ncbi:alpha/beta hydrolase [Salmonella enterica subsp. enterica serovar Infantis]|nr:alpha/beta hydrolase [Salmonella enterica subsp. enterica serovar Infantis]
MIAIQYRLAPEHTFPAAHDDAERGANIVYQYAEQLGIDRERITLAGDSAGGHLALVSALRLKSTAHWSPAKLLLIYPMLDATASFPAMPATGKTTSSPAIRCYRVSKCISGTDLRHPEASPIWREDFAGLPPVHILTAEFDPLRDEGEALYHRLNDRAWRVLASAISVLSMAFSSSEA